MLYRSIGVPVIISTDDAGVLRSSITEQFVLLAQRYSRVRYADLKEFVYNSIRYSFIKEPALKKQLLERLDADFIRFEDHIKKYQLSF